MRVRSPVGGAILGSGWRRPGRVTDVGVGDAAGDEAEKNESAGEDVKIASHADGSILRRAGAGVFRSCLNGDCRPDLAGVSDGPHHPSRGPSRRKRDGMKGCARAGSWPGTQVRIPSSGLLSTSAPFFGRV